MFSDQTLLDAATAPKGMKQRHRRITQADSKRETDISPVQVTSAASEDFCRHEQINLIFPYPPFSTHANSYRRPELTTFSLWAEYTIEMVRITDSNPLSHAANTCNAAKLLATCTGRPFCMRSVCAELPGHPFARLAACNGESPNQACWITAQYS